MNGYELSERAKCDLREIGDITARRPLSACFHLLERMEKSFELIASQPGIGERADDFIVGCRMFLVANYVVFHRETPDGVHISRIFHSSRDFGQIV